MVATPAAATRTCLVCRRELDVDRFHRSGNHSAGRRRTCKTCIADAQRRTRRERGSAIRHPRYNARGDVWCNRCQRYQGAENFKRHPSRPHTYWSYCKVCTREVDRARYAKKTSTLEGALEVLEDHNRSKRRRMQREFAGRRRFLVDSISLLRRRGLTKAEIVRLTDTTFGNLLKWERGECLKPTKAVCERFAIVVRESGALPAGEPVYRRRLPHPAMGELLARCLPLVEAVPIRNAWKNGRRSE